MRPQDLVEKTLFDWINKLSQKWADKAKINIDYALRSILLALLFLAVAVLMLIPMFGIWLWNVGRWSIKPVKHTEEDNQA